VISVDEALDIVLRETGALPPEEVRLAEAEDRVLAESVGSDCDLPRFDRAAMDGFALRASDVSSAPVALEIVGEVRAGQWPSCEVGPGEAVRIMTGAPVPPGATAVQPVEKTQALDEFRVTILSEVATGAHIAPRGCEVREGDEVLAPGRVIDPSAVAVLAQAGRARVRVGRRPAVAVLVTGDEVVGVGDEPTAGQIRNSNGPAVCALARRHGALVRDLGVAADREDALVAALRPGLDADVLVVSGGVSAGDYDLVRPALEGLGVLALFTGVAIKPGAPLVFGRRGTTLVFGLPGNPVSAQVAFELFVGPALRRLQGAHVVQRPWVGVELLAPVRNRSGRRAHLPVRVRWEDGRLVARPVRSMGSGDLVAHARANALVVVDPERTEIAAGERADAVLVGRFMEDDGAPL